MPENMDITEDPLTVQDILDEAEEPGPYHTILEVWREVLKPVVEERKKRITPQWANRICTAYKEITFAVMPDFKKRYFDKLDELREILEAEIATDDECLNALNPEEDAELNSAHYLNILTNWQKAFLYWELQWNCENAGAATELAAISEVHRMMFDNTGLSSLLDNINFQFTETDQEYLAAELQSVISAQVE